MKSCPQSILLQLRWFGWVVRFVASVRNNEITIKDRRNGAKREAQTGGPKFRVG